MAEEGIKYLNKSQQYQLLHDPTVMNTVMYSAFNGTRDRLTPEQRSHNIDIENVTCFHCGNVIILPMIVELEKLMFLKMLLVLELGLPTVLK